MNIGKLTKEFLLANMVIGSNGCWIWTRAKNSDGYGIASVKRKTKIISRVAFSFWVGPIPDNMCVLHRCDNPPCLNPYHLFLGTKGDNARDRASKGRSAHNRSRAKISIEDAIEIRKISADGILTQTEIGERFGLCQSAVSRINTNTNWRNVIS